VPRTKPLVALDDGRYWRRLLATLHPDSDAGDQELFVFLTALREHVEGCHGTSVAAYPDVRTTRDPTPRDGAKPDRIPYDPQLGYVDEFVDLTLRALSIGKRSEEPFRSLLALLLDCDATDHGRRAARQCRGATYKQLAFIAHLAGCDAEERFHWYEVARTVPLSEAHAGHILTELKRQAAA
jgi:hypothetical protein